MPPPSTTSAMSVTAAIGAMWSAIRRASSSHHLPRERVAGARRGEDRRARRTAAAASCSPPFSATSRSASAETADAHGSISSLAPGRDEVDLAGGAVTAAVQLAAQHEAGAEAGADGEEDEVLDAPRHAAPALADRGEVDVVLDASPAARAASRRSLAQSRPSRPGTLVASVSRPVSASTTPGTPTTAPSIRSAGSPLASASETRRPAIASIARLGVGAVELDVLPRADLAAQVADRAAQEARAEVEAEHEPRLGHDLEEGGAVGRPARVGRGLAHEAGVEQRLERERDGRLRDPRPARDLGARDRRAGADRVEHGALVQVLQERRDCGAAGHRGRNFTRICRRMGKFAGTLTSSATRCRVASVNLTNRSPEPISSPATRGGQMKRVATAVILLASLVLGTAAVRQHRRRAPRPPRRDRASPRRRR